MPYINKDKRKDVEAAISVLVMETDNNPGQLNYVISRLIHLKLLQCEVTYAHINEVIGVLECCKLELYSQVIRPYEDKKKLANGSVSNLDDTFRERMR